MVYGLLYGLAMIAHRMFDRAVKGITWADAVRASIGWQVLGWATTITIHLQAGLVIVRMPSWAVRLSTILRSFVPNGSSPGLLFPGVPPGVPFLIGLGLVGHLSALLPRPTWAWGDNLGSAIRGLGYAVLVAGLVCFSPGVGKSFIYIQF